MLSEIFRHQQLPKYSIFMCIDCTYYSEGKTIFSEIFRRKLLLKNFILSQIQCTSSLSHKQYFPRFQRRELPKYFIFVCIMKCTYYTGSKPTAAEILHSHVYWARILLRRQRNILAPTAAEILHFHVYFVRILYRRQSNIFWNISAPTAAEIFYLHVYWLHILLRRQTIFSEISRHQLLPKNFIFTWIQCTYSLSHKQYSLEYFAPKSQCYFHMYWVSILLCILLRRQTNILRNIAAPTGTEIFRFYMYWLRILHRRQNNILRNISAPTAAERFHFHTVSVHMFHEPQTIFPGVFRPRELPKYLIFMCIKCTYYPTH